MDKDSFSGLLTRLQSVDHDVRTEAETALTNIPPPNRLSLLLQSMADASLTPESENPGLREIACHLFASVPAVFGPDHTANMPHIAHMLNQALADQSLKVRIAGFRALCAFLVHNSTETSVQHALKDLAQPALMILVNSELADPMRHMALEVIITLSENIPSGVRKAGKDLIEPLVRTLLNMMTDLEEDPEWETVDAAEEDEEDSNAVTAEMALDRFACAMGSQQVLNEIIRTVPTMLQDSKF
ncbi:unnamed protein product [Dibothriocephalus latus]|uniref:TOG domain-containing protein n=1 Tax=Dibothriocephalus latus TaxID=60516 RepID=A0A3P7LEY2_DIBLA|nr:unnamed protein product [Dibothriocephalus latus]